jgi:Zn-dependent peptidase ImmA (M78 family)
MTNIEGLGRFAPDYRFVKADVKKVLEENSITSPPVSPKEIAENYGIKVMFAELPDALDEVQGFFDFDRRQIFVNLKDPPNRQTYTIAHELGHFRLHSEYIRTHPKEYKVLLRQPLAGEKNPIEQEANAFAAHLLIPRDMLQQYVSIASQSELARLFNVSEEVVRWRIINENLVLA